METLPLVSILIPAYNATAYIAQAVHSIISQTYQKLEIIIVDDGSTDGTFDLVKSLSEEDHRIQIIHQSNSGASVARNHAYRLSQGQFIKFFDADDFLAPQSIAAQLCLAQSHPGSIISGRWGRFYQSDFSDFSLSPEKVWKDMTGIDWLLESWSPPPNMTQPGIFLIPRILIESTGLWDEELTLLDDMPFFTRLILAAPQVIFCEDSILYYRSGLQTSLSRQYSPRALQSALRAIDLSVSYLLAARRDEIALQACANQYFILLHQVYPDAMELVEQLEIRIQQLGVNPNIVQGTPFQKMLSPLLGWKVAKRMHRLIRAQ